LISVCLSVFQDEKNDLFLTYDDDNDKPSSEAKETNYDDYDIFEGEDEPLSPMMKEKHTIMSFGNGDGDAFSGTSNMSSISSVAANEANEVTMR
jgi:hypothetical protein